MNSSVGNKTFTNRSAAELMQSIQYEGEDIAIAVQEYGQAQAALANLRVQADDLLGEVMAQLRYAGWTQPVSIASCVPTVQKLHIRKMSHRMSRRRQRHKSCTNQKKAEKNLPFILFDQ